MNETSRDKILHAAARVYAELGFRGATTRRIAQEAEVNEVTLFRIFGSKDALLREAIQARGPVVPPGQPVLPHEPVDPERELKLWCVAHLAQLRASASLLRKTMSEMEERPELGAGACEGPNCAAQELRDYLMRLRKRGLIDADVPLQAAASMLISALMGDAMVREVMPERFPQPAEAAPLMYTRLFLRAIGLRQRPARATATKRSSGRST
jgi:AcrR family transcriptional regulator